jgi:predicted MPP superfamily phosphohydrolase
MILAQNEKLDFLINFANENRADILSAGDQTDTPRDFLSLWILMNKLKNLKQNFYCCIGQHDKYARSEQPSSVKILIEHGYFRRLYNNIPTPIQGFNVFGCDFGEDPIEPKTDNNILVVHDTITTIEMAIKNVKIKDAEEYANKNKKYGYIIVGDVHRRFLLKTKNNTILNSGPVLRDDASEYFLDYEPGFYFLDKSKIELIKFPYKKDVISRVHIKNKKEATMNFNVQKGESKDIVELIKSDIELNCDKEEKKAVSKLIFG